MERVALKVEVRENAGKGVARKLREKGMIPAVIYGHDREPIAITVKRKEVEPLEGKNALVDVEFGNGKEMVVLKETQHDPLKGILLHADFQAIKLKEKIKITVPVILTGTPAGTIDGGVLSQIMREVDVECLPTEMVDNLEVDVTHLKVGDSLSVAEINAANLEITTDSTEVIATVSLPSIAEDVEEGEGALDATPEESAQPAVEEQ